MADTINIKNINIILKPAITKRTSDQKESPLF